jgi:hypothetical protein
MYDAIIKRAQALFKADPKIFSQAKAVFLDLPDAHSVSVVTSHLGLPLHKIKLGKYKIHSKDTQVPKESLLRYKKTCLFVAVFTFCDSQDFCHIAA